MAEMRERYRQMFDEAEGARQATCYSMIVGVLGEAGTPLDAKNSIHAYEVVSAEDAAKIFQTARYELERMAREA